MGMEGRATSANYVITEDLTNSDEADMALLLISFRSFL